MSRDSRPSMVLAIALGLAAALLNVPTSTSVVAVPAAPAGMATRSATVPPIAWHRCGGPFECARFKVPLDYDDPHGRMISLALIRLPAADPALRQGTLFTNPGGPGEFGVDFVRNAARRVYPQRVRDRFDILGFDPRGVGKSSPLHCFASFKEENRFLNRLPIFPTNRSEVRATISANRELGERCAESDADLLSHMSTAEVARDMDQLRRAVGDRRLTFAGYSYGSMVGLTYANLFPTKVRAVIVDGVIDPSSWIGRGRVGERVPVDVRLASDTGSDAALKAFLDACQDNPESCAFASTTTHRKFRLLMRNVRHGGIRAPAPIGSVTYDFAINEVLHRLYGYGQWTKLSDYLQQLWLHRDQPAASASLPPRSTGRGTGEPRYANYLEASYAVTCGETNNPSDPFVWSKYANKRSKVSRYFGAYWAWLDGPCATWPAFSSDRYAGPFNRTTANPILVIGNLRDPATRYRDAQDAAARMRGARLLTIDGTGHTSLTQPSRCARSAAAHYLISKALPAKGTVCSIDKPPFFR